MKDPKKSHKKSKDSLVTKYPALKKDEIANDYTFLPLNYKEDQIEKYHVVFWHRLLRMMYEVPFEIECEIQNRINESKGQIKSALFRKTEVQDRWVVQTVDETFLNKLEKGEVKPFPINWKYLIRLPSGGVVELGTRDRNTVFHVGYATESGYLSENDFVEATRFVDLILEEADRLKGKLFKPKEEFDRKDLGLRFYLLFNIYLSNYMSAQTILSVAESEEVQLKTESLKYDAMAHFYNEEKMQHVYHHMITCGTFYCSAIAYLFMALEGFVNLVFHAFLKAEFRKGNLGIERLILEQKIRLMPYICKGFTGDSNFLSGILDELNTLKTHRNRVFHSTVGNYLKSLCFVEDGFWYNYDIEANEATFLPSRKLYLTIEDVNKAKDIVDKSIEAILKSMDQDTRTLAEKCMLKKPFISFTVSQTGEVALVTRTA